MAAAKKDPPHRKKPARAIPRGWLTITQACLILQRPYQRTRNLALMGSLGPTKYDARERTLLVSEAGVRAALTRLKRITLPTTPPTGGAPIQ